MENKSFRRRIIDMEVGQQITTAIDIVGYSTIRSYASDLGFALNRKYSVSRNRVCRTYTITREA